MFVCVSNLDTYGKSPKVSLQASKLGAEEELSYIAAQLKQFEDDRMMKNLALKPVEDLLTSLSEYKQTLEQYLQNVTMTSLSEDWKKLESQKLSDIVQARIKYVQVRHVLTLYSLYKSVIYKFCQRSKNYQINGIINAMIIALI